MSEAVLVDSNVLLDLFTNDAKWAEWSERTLHAYAASHRLGINMMIYTEVSVGFERADTLHDALAELGCEMLAIPLEALFLTGKVFLEYRRRGGAKRAPLPDFFIGAHAAVAEMPLITRDTARYRRAFPGVELIAP